MKLLHPNRGPDPIPALSWCSGEVPAGGKLDLELLEYVTEADFIALGPRDAPRHPLLPAVFRPERLIVKPPVSHSLLLASLRLESRARDSDEECLVDSVPLAMFLPALALPTKPAGDRYRLTVLSHSASAEKFQLAAYGLVLPPKVTS